MKPSPRRLFTLALIPLIGMMTFAQVPDASAKGFKSFKGHRSSFRGKRNFNRNFNRGFNRGFNRNFNRGFRNSRQFSRNFNRGFNQNFRFQNRRFNNRSFNKGFANAGGFDRVVFVDRPVTFTQPRTSTLADERFLGEATDSRRNATPRRRAAVDPAYAVAGTRPEEAWGLLESGRFAQAQLAFGRLASASPQSARPKVGFALASAALGEHDRAGQAFARANSVNSDVWETFGNRPVVRAVARDLKENNYDAFDETARTALDRLIAETEDAAPADDAGEHEEGYDTTSGEQTVPEAQAEASGEA